MTIREASTAVIEKNYGFWKRARVPLAHKTKMIEKFEVLAVPKVSASQERS